MQGFGNTRSLRYLLKSDGGAATPSLRHPLRPLPNRIGVSLGLVTTVVVPLADCTARGTFSLVQLMRGARAA